jgi:hypothetical protein
MACDVCLGRNSERCPICGTPKVKITCPTCKGFGFTDCTALDIYTDEVTDVTPTAYFLLPDTPDEARAKGLRFCKDDACRCPHCWGEGVVPEGY